MTQRPRDLSQAGLAELTHFSADLICKVEKAVRWPLREFTEACDAALDTGGALGRLWPWVETEHQKALEESANASHADSAPVHPDAVGGAMNAAHLPPARRRFLSHTGRGNRTRSGRWGSSRWPATAHSWPGWSGGAPPSLEEQLLMAAHESAEFSDHPSDVGKATLDRLRSDVTRLARSFANAPRLEVFTQARWLRDRTFQLLDGRQRRTEFRDLHFLAGATCGMLANITQDFGFYDAAMAHARTAWFCAEQAGHNGLKAWILSRQSLIAYNDGRPADAALYSGRGQEYAPTGTIGVSLVGLEARATSRLGDSERTRAALARSSDARERVTPDALDEMGGILSFSVPKQHHYDAESYLGIGETAAAVAEAESCVSGYRTGPEEQHAYDNEASAWVNAATAHVLDRDLDAAREAVEPAFGIARELRNDPLNQRFRRLHRHLTEPAFANSAQATDLRDQIEDFLATSTPP
ncbi:MAG TPA: hypothetical protein VIS06_17770, partial [Mycobacteriales bacterium]